MLCSPQFRSFKFQSTILQNQGLPSPPANLKLAGPLGQREDLSGSPDVDVEGPLQVLVEADGGRAVEDDLDPFDEGSGVLDGEAEARKGAVAPDRHQAVLELAGRLQAVEDLEETVW